MLSIPLRRKCFPPHVISRIALALALVALTSCVYLPAVSDPMPTPLPGETALPFESILQLYDFSRPSVLKTFPAALVADTPQESEERIAPLVPLQPGKLEQQVDFEQEFVIAVFQGRFGAGCCHIAVQRVARHGEQLVVYAELAVPDPTAPPRPMTQMVNYPFHVVKVQRDGGPVRSDLLTLVTWRVYER